MSNVSGSHLSNKKSQQIRNAGMGQAKFKRDGQSGGADNAPSMSQGKGMGKMKPKQAKYGNKPDAGGGPMKASGPHSSSAYSRSGGQIG